ncbi:MAG: hypothetical protein JRD89_00730 [Deltaproteobacteria bacterium]|nr:hypothetical protein [Deltaproteobacteria bacterium]
MVNYRWLVKALENYPARKIPGVGYQYTVDLGSQHSDELIIDFFSVSPGYPAVWMTVFKLDGNIDIRLMGMDLNTLFYLELTPLSWPQMVVVDDVAIRQVKVTNTAQSGKSCVLLFARLPLKYIEYT